MAIDTPAVTSGFLDDVKASLAAWRKAPGLPIVAAGLIVTSGLTASPHGNGAVLLALFVVGIISIGWIGTQLVWYRRAFAGAAMGIDELIQVTLRFVPRYFWLLCIAFLPLGAVIAVIAIKSHTPAVLQSPGGRLGLLAYISIVESIGTFVVPGLAFS